MPVCTIFVCFLLVQIVTIHELRIFQRVSLNFRNSKFVEHSVYTMVLNEVTIYTNVCNHNKVDLIFYNVKMERCVSPSSGLYTFVKKAPTQVILNEKYYESFLFCFMEKDI